MSRDTHLAGSPADLDRVATWLTDVVPATSTFGDEVYGARSATGSAWESEAATAFAAQLRTLGAAADGTSTAVRTAAAVVADLAAALRTAQDEMRRARQIAREGGLGVTGTVIQPPGQAPASVPALPPDATPAEVARHDQGTAALTAYEREVTAWNDAVAVADAADRDWEQAVADATLTWQESGKDIAALLQDLFSGSAEEFLKIKVSRYFSDATNVWRQQSQVWREIADSYVRDGRFVGTDPDDYYRALRNIDEMDDLARNAELNGGRVATNVGRGFLALGVIATGYGIYDDMANGGESAEQATTSNVGGFLAGMGAGAASGAAAGAIAGSIVPGAGTAVGAVVGTVVGAGVGIVTSGAIDSMWENGVEDLGDVGEAIGDGWGELMDTGEAIGDLGSDAVDAVGDGISDAWNSVFG